MEYRVVQVDSLGKGRLRLAYAHGEVVDVDLSPLIEKGGVFTRLADDGYLNAVQIMEGGYYLEWPDELDIGADSLWLRGVKIESVSAKPPAPPKSS